MNEVRLDWQGGAAIITIDRPQARNAIGLATMGQLDSALSQVARADASVLVVTGGGQRAFVSGGDLKELETIRTAEEAEHMARRMRAVLDRLISLPMPVIAAINGHALGGGAEVAIAADVRVAADDVRIGFTQSSLGIMPAWGGVERLTELVGRSRALLLLCGGEPVSAEQALAMGLVDQVLARDVFEAGWRGLAARFASVPPAATRSIKDVVSTVSPGTHPATEAGSVRAFGSLWVTAEHWDMAAAAEQRRRQAREGDGPRG